MQNELYERELQNISINDVSLADYVKENYVPMSVIEDIKQEIEDIDTTKVSDDFVEYIPKTPQEIIENVLEIIDKHTKGASE